MLATILTLLVSLLPANKIVNPVIPSDYSDPDVIAVDGEYWMTSSSFNCVPGLQILHSTDLVNWEIVGAALPHGIDDCRLPGEARPDAPEHGGGVFAPSLRYHDGRFWIFWGDPDRGIFQVNTTDPRGEWSKPVLVLEAKGIIDTCPLWDDDGRVYLFHAWAGSRVGYNSVLSACELSSDCTKVISSTVMVFNGLETGNTTVEGAKAYKRNGWYYIMAPAGGVATGWQLVMRSRNVRGPYEWRNVLDEGTSGVHGPHQGGWIDDTDGNSWFMHFEDKGAWGRVVHLQKLVWKDDWCVIGNDPDGDGCGQPETSLPIPQLGKKPVKADASAKDHGVSALAMATDFNGVEIPLNWQWQAAPQFNWYMTNPAEGSLRLNCLKVQDGWRNLWDSPNIILEKVAGPGSCLQAKLHFCPSAKGDRAGLTVMGIDYATLEMVYDGKEITLQQRRCVNAEAGGEEEILFEHPLKGTVSQSSIDMAASHPWAPVERRACFDVYVRVSFSEGNSTGRKAPDCICSFEYSEDGKKWKSTGVTFKAREGKWIGAKTGFFSIAQIKRNNGGYLMIQ